MSEISSYINNTTNSGLLNSMFSVDQAKTNFTTPYNSTSNLLSMSFGGAESTSSVMTSLLNAKTEALILSSTGSKLSDVYTELTNAGFEGEEVENFVAASQALDEGAITDYVETASDINEIGGRDLMVDWVNKAADLLNTDTAKGLDFIAETQALLAQEYEATDDQTPEEQKLESIESIISEY